jgi:acetoacetyl-CoA synthetase
VYVPPPEAVLGSQLTAFARAASARAGRDLSEWAALSAWSVDEASAFWALLLEWFGWPYGGDPEPVLEGYGVETARFFPRVRLNYAEVLLTRGDLDAVVLSARGEGGARSDLTRAALRREVARVRSGLAALGVRSGDRVAAVVTNDADAAIACLATVSLGAAWSSVAPDMGRDAIVSRFAQLAPTVLIAHATSRFQGAARDHRPLVGELACALPTVRDVVGLGEDWEPSGLGDAALHRWRSLGDVGAAERFERVPWDHPLFVLFSSGTTGPPKCIVHGHGGTALEHEKELRLHTDLRPGDTLYFHTSAGWMMWNWMLSGLATGARVLTYDGSVSWPERDSLLQMLADEGVTVFGTSPAYIQYLLLSGIVPPPGLALRAVLSTGSPLYPHHFDWIRDHLDGPSIQSISGGTDIIGCFVLGNPNLPVVRGRSQCVSLGCDVRAAHGTELARVGSGELVCASPFPSRPVGLFGDPSGSRFHDAYFAERPGVWSHGDFVELTDDGGARILGRCDGVMNIRGVRIGPAELYPVVLQFDAIRLAAAVDQEAPREPGGRRLVLLVVVEGGVALDRPLQLQIKKALKTALSMNHVPSVLAAVPDLPVTHSGKVSERAIADLLNGRPVRNRAALRNPEALDALATMPELARPAG